MRFSKTKNPFRNFEMGFYLPVRMEGLEPAHLAAPDPKSGASTNFATSASKKIGVQK